MKTIKSDLSNYIRQKLAKIHLDKATFKVIKEEAEEHTLTIKTHWTPGCRVRSTQTLSGDRTRGTYNDNQSNMDACRKEASNKFRATFWQKIGNQKTWAGLSSPLSVHNFPEALSTLEKCFSCGGSGEIACYTCMGTGTKENHRQLPSGKYIVEWIPCPPRQTCPTCFGAGSSTRLRYIEAIYTPSSKVYRVKSALMGRVEKLLKSRGENWVTWLPSNSAFSLTTTDKKNVNTEYQIKVHLKHSVIEIDGREYMFVSYSLVNSVQLLTYASVVDNYLQDIGQEDLIGPAESSKINSLKLARKKITKIQKYPLLKAIVDMHGNKKLEKKDLPTLGHFISPDGMTALLQSIKTMTSNADIGFPFWFYPSLLFIFSFAWFHSSTRHLENETFSIGALGVLLLTLSVGIYRHNKNAALIESIRVKGKTLKFFIFSMIALAIFSYKPWVVSEGYSFINDNHVGIPALKKNNQVAFFDTAAEQDSSNLIWMGGKVWAKIGITYSYFTAPTMTIEQRQEALKTIGYYFGTIDGDWGTGSKKAMKQLMHSLEEKRYIGDRFKNGRVDNLLEFNQPDKFDIFLHSALWLHKNGYEIQ